MVTLKLEGVSFEFMSPNWTTTPAPLGYAGSGTPCTIDR
jgi:hypothetical protein